MWHRIVCLLLWHTGSHTVASLLKETLEACTTHLVREIWNTMYTCHQSCWPLSHWNCHKCDAVVAVQNQGGKRRHTKKENNSPFTKIRTSWVRHDNTTWILERFVSSFHMVEGQAHYITEKISVFLFLTFHLHYMFGKYLNPHRAPKDLTRVNSRVFPSFVKDLGAHISQENVFQFKKNKSFPCTFWVSFWGFCLFVVVFVSLFGHFCFLWGSFGSLLLCSVSL